MEPPARRPPWRVGILIAWIAGVSLAHYLTPPEHFLLHNVYQRLYYIPILLAAAWFGLRGSLSAAIVCAASYAPHIVLHWAHIAAYQANQGLELAMFGAVAVVAGVLSDRERKLRHQAEATAAERDRALKDLEATVETLRQADRLATLGTLTAGIAHEIRNPLGSIGGAVEILEGDYAQSHPHREFVEIIRREIGRLNVIAGKYLDFARPQPPALRAVDLGAAVESAVGLVRRTAGRSSVEIRTRAVAGAPRAHADPVQVHQVLVNLVLNGIQSMPSGGVVEVAVRPLDAAWMEVSVRDHGAGLPDGPVERLFEPFFTTKPGGTGLGLAMSRGIAEAHGGRLLAEDALGGGAVFRLILPTAPREEGP
jgi:two-component system, NtrC family, sensor histidine kinase HydH